MTKSSWTPTALGIVCLAGVDWTAVPGSVNRAVVNLIPGFGHGMWPISGGVCHGGHSKLRQTSANPRAAPRLEGSPARLVLRTQGTVYRVGHAIAALMATGWQASWLPAGDPQVADRAEAADIVVVFRAALTDDLAAAGLRQRHAITRPRLRSCR